MALWAAHWERDKEMVGRASHEAWLAWLIESSPIKHFPAGGVDGGFPTVQISVPEKDRNFLGDTFAVLLCAACGESVSSHRPTTYPAASVWDYCDRQYLATWDDLGEATRETIVNAVGGRERYRLGFAAGQAACLEQLEELT